MKLAIFGRITERTDTRILKEFLEYLDLKEIEWIIYEPYFHSINEKFSECFSGKQPLLFNQKEELHECQYLLCFGGDGTVLEAVNFSGSLGKPILGVNFGRLGYLTSITQTELIPAIEELVRGMYRIDKRSMLTVVSDPPGLFVDNPCGINDLTIHKSNTNEMITVHTYINGEYLNSYWGDGLIVATPTGSTAYSLSCGGPIIFPSAATFCITPVAPHSLTVRPVVIPDDWVVSFEIESRSGEAMVALDTRTQVVKAGTMIAARIAPFSIKLLKLSSTKHADNLRRSLMWGYDNRN